MNADQWPARRVLCAEPDRCAMPLCTCGDAGKECPTPVACELPEVADANSMRHHIETRVLLAWMIVAVVACLLAVVL